MKKKRRTTKIATAVPKKIYASTKFFPPKMLIVLRKMYFFVPTWLLSHVSLTLIS